MSFPLAPVDGTTHTVDGFVVWKYDNGIWEIASSSTDGLAISTNLGSFLGTLIPDNVGTLEALQVLETATEEALNSSRGLVTLSGMPANSIHLDTFSGTIITDGGTIKDALQELETAVALGASSAFLADGSVAMTGPLDMGNNAITNVADPTSGIEVGDRDYNDSRYVEVTGDNMTGPLVLATTNGLSLTSTAHGFQNGFSTGQNIAMSNNEIVARNNGATAPLYLNRFGGDVNVGTAGATGQLKLNGEDVWSLYNTADPDARYMRLEASGISANALNFGTFTGAILPDNSDLKAILQALETYIAAVPLSKQTVSTNEAARLLLTPTDGDVNYTQDASADPDVTSGAAMYVYGSSQWNRIAEFESLDVETNLTLGTVSGTGIEIVSSTGLNVTLPAVTATTAGLMPSTILSALGIGATDSNMGTFTGTTITDNVSLKAGLQELETAHDAAVAAGFKADGTTAMTGTFDGGAQLINNIADPTADTHVGDRLYNDGRYGSLAATGLAAQASDYGTFTGGTIGDNVTNKVALQQLETALEASTSGAFKHDGSVAMTGTFDGGAQLINNIADPTADTHVGDRLYNDGRYGSLAATGLAAQASDYGTFTGSIISDNVSAKVALQELESAIIAGDSGDFRADGTVAMTGAFDGGAQLLTNIADPTADTHVGDRLYNDTRYNTHTGLAAGAANYGTFTGTTISDNVTSKVALQELEVALETAIGNTLTQAELEAEAVGTAAKTVTQATISGLFEIDSANSTFAFGTNAALSNTAANVTAMGANAGQNNTGSELTAVGSSAAINNTGASSTMIGRNAGHTNTGVGIAVVGRNSGHSNTGDGLSALGVGAGGLNTGDQLTAIGNGAGVSNTADEVTALGSAAGVTNTAIGATFVGYNVGATNTGDYLTAVGHSAATTNTGANVTAIGATAAQNNTGSDVVAIGNGAGSSNAGDQSVFVGSLSGNGASGILNTFLGYGSGSGQSGSINIGIGWEAAKNNTGNSVLAIGRLSAENNTGSSITAVGSAAASNNTGGNLSAFGVGAGLNNTGAQLTAIGGFAADANTGASVTAVGYQSAQNNTNDNVTAIGTLAGQNNTGNFLTAIGTDAGLSNSGNNVTIVGEGAGINNTGNHLSAFGRDAATNNSGAFSTFLGRNSGANNTGTNSTGIGFGAGNSNIAGGLVAVGVSSGSQNTGTEVIAVGGSSASLNTGNNLAVLGHFSGSQNTGDNLSAIGFLSGQLNSGTGVSILGHSAGISNTFSNVSIIGANAVATADNQVMLGDTLTEQVFTHGVFRTATYDQTALPDPTLFKGGICYMENGLGGGQDNCMIFSNGVEWRKIQNGALQ